MRTTESAEGSMGARPRVRGGERQSASAWAWRLCGVVAALRLGPLPHLLQDRHRVTVPLAEHLFTWRRARKKERSTPVARRCVVKVCVKLPGHHAASEQQGQAGVPRVMALRGTNGTAANTRELQLLES
jgi:hypothetical protein